MKKYRTHLIVNRRDSEKIRDLVFPDIRVHLTPEPTKRYWESLDGNYIGTFSDARDLASVRDDEIPLDELLVEAANEEVAEDFMSVVQGGMLLAFPDPSLLHNFTFLEECDNNLTELNDSKFLLPLRKFENVAFGCLIAEKVLNDNRLVYAIEKYKTSLGLTSFDPRSADPAYGRVFDNYYAKREYHTNAAFSIIAAFSVVEELGLEVRSSLKKPRFLNPASGEWNPSVLNDIQQRLNESNISNEITFDWAYRGAPTRIEQKIKPYFGFDSEWTKFGESVRDKTLTMPEAIHNASYLRNYIAAHKFNELTQFISPYDVFNVQCLARVLVIRKLNLWDTMLNRNK